MTKPRQSEYEVNSKTTLLSEFYSTTLKSVTIQKTFHKVYKLSSKITIMKVSGSNFVGFLKLLNQMNLKNFDAQDHMNCRWKPSEMNN